MKHRNGKVRHEAWIAVLLLSLYAFGSVVSALVHHTFHFDQEARLHSVDNENDACHRTVFHQDADNGCDHEAHVGENEQCDLCNIVFRSAHLALPQTVSDIKWQDAFFLTGLAGLSLPAADLEQSPRGPPVV